MGSASLKIKLPPYSAHCETCDWLLPEHSPRCPEWKGEPIPPGEPLRECFKCAALFMLVNQDKPQAVLCHGEVEFTLEPGTWDWHAWVELPAEATYDDGSKGPITVVIDKTQERPSWVLPAEFFYEKTKARNVKRYTFAEMLKRCIRYRTDGPWSD